MGGFWRRVDVAPCFFGLVTNSGAGPSELIRNPSMGPFKTSSNFCACGQRGGADPLQLDQSSTLPEASPFFGTYLWGESGELRPCLVAAKTLAEHEKEGRPKWGYTRKHPLTHAERCRYQTPNRHRNRQITGNSTGA